MTTTSADELQLPRVGDESGLEPDWRIYPEELQLAFRNHSIMLEGLRYDRTPTGMHYTLTHYDVPATDASTWQVSIDGAVRQSLALTLEHLQRRKVVTQRVTLECAGDGRGLLRPRPVAQPWLHGAAGTADWTGTPLRDVLEEAGVLPDAREVVLTGADRGFEGGVEQEYQRALTLKEALRDEVLLAWAMNDAALEPQHGAPLRLVVPGWYGMTSVKWLRRVSVVSEPFTGYQNTRAYRYGQSRDEIGEPVSLMRVRSLMVPPGIPDFMTRTRVVDRGTTSLEGRAWSGRSRVVRVEVSADGGATWTDAQLDPPLSSHAWQGWRFTWTPSPGSYDLCCRATDAAGNTQPVDQFWTARGMGNNAVQRVSVIVR